MIKGINIYSKSDDQLGRALTNPSYAKNNKSEYDIIPWMKNPFQENWILPENFNLPFNNLFKWAIHKYGNKVTAKHAWGYSVESWYFANTKGNFNYSQSQKELIMYNLIIQKFKTYSNLINEIDKRGGLEFLEKCWHINFENKGWKGIGYKSNFIKILIFSYINVTTGEDFRKTIMKEEKGLFA